MGPGRGRLGTFRSYRQGLGRGAASPCSLQEEEGLTDCGEGQQGCHCTPGHQPSPTKGLTVSLFPLVLGEAASPSDASSLQSKDSWSHQ